MTPDDLDRLRRRVTAWQASADRMRRDAQDLLLRAEVFKAAAADLEVDIHAIERGQQSPLEAP